MVLTHSSEGEALDRAQRATLLRVARNSILHGLEHAAPLPVRISDYPPALGAVRASFVTLHLGGDLRGCIGHLEAVQPLVKDVADNAYAAAFRDPRFAPLRAAEFPEILIQVSVLTPPERLRIASEQELVAVLRPGRDGLILENGSARGTFLPSVWDSLPDPVEFLRHLRVKAGLPPGYWSDRLRVYRYESESFGDSPEAHSGAGPDDRLTR